MLSTGTLWDLKELLKERQLFKPRIGVYFLFLQDKLVYIGSSSNLDARLWTHRRGRRIEWTSCTIIECQSHIQALRLESAYIKELHPPMNKVLREMDAPTGEAKLVRLASLGHTRRSMTKKSEADFGESIKPDDPIMRRLAQRRAWWAEHGVEV
jgi:predicted GIY-YIG superfamily endonuclease